MGQPATADDFRPFDGSLGGILYSGNHEVGQGAALKFGGTLEHGVQVGTDSRLESSGCSGGGHGVDLLLPLYGNMPGPTTRQLGNNPPIHKTPNS